MLQRITLRRRRRVRRLGHVRSLPPQHGLEPECGRGTEGQFLLPAQIQAAASVGGRRRPGGGFQVSGTQGPRDAVAVAAVGAGPGAVWMEAGVVGVEEVVVHLLVEPRVVLEGSRVVVGVHAGSETVERV